MIGRFLRYYLIYLNIFILIWMWFTPSPIYALLFNLFHGTAIMWNVEKRIMKLQNAQGMLEGQKKMKFQYAQPFLSKKISSLNGMSQNSGPRSPKLELMSLRKLQLISNYSSNRHHHPDQQAVNENNVLATSIIYIYYIDFSYVSSRV